MRLADLLGGFGTPARLSRESAALSVAAASLGMKMRGPREASFTIGDVRVAAGYGSTDRVTASIVFAQLFPPLDLGLVLRPASVRLFAADAIELVRGLFHARADEKKRLARLLESAPGLTDRLVAARHHYEIEIDDTGVTLYEHGDPAAHFFERAVPVAAEMVALIDRARRAVLPAHAVRSRAAEYEALASALGASVVHAPLGVVSGFGQPALFSRRGEGGTSTARAEIFVDEDLDLEIHRAAPKPRSSLPSYEDAFDRHYVASGEHAKKLLDTDLRAALLGLGQLGALSVVRSTLALEFPALPVASEATRILNELASMAEEIRRRLRNGAARSVYR